MDENNHDHPGDVWMDFDAALAEDATPFTTGTLSGVIRPENGRFPINEVVNQNARECFVRLLTIEPLKLAPDTAEAVAEAVRDWIDDDDEGEYEAPAYRALEAGYEPPNAELTGVAELLLVKGVNHELLYGDGERPGLAEFITVHDGGGVNLNFAPLNVLMALCPEDVSEGTARELAQAILEFRDDPLNHEVLAEKSWYRTEMFGFSDVRLREELVTTTSSIYRVRLDARCGAVLREVSAVLTRGGGPTQGGEPAGRIRLARMEVN